MALLAVLGSPPGQAEPNLDPESRLTQEQIASGSVSLTEIRRAGMLVFTTPFNKADGFGDGPFDPDEADQRALERGNRPSLQGNGTFLRVNGLDAQTCLECHGIVSNRTIPATFGVGGSGGINNSAMLMPSVIDVGDSDFDGKADYNGRVINPPFIFGAGGVELLALEMTEELQGLKQQALDNPGVSVGLVTKGVDFGTLVADGGGSLDTSGVVGVDGDLVVRPFGRKGNNATLRQFDLGAMMFHMGMQPVESLASGAAVDDNDGVDNEMTRGDITALSIFQATLEPPTQKRDRSLSAGSRLFDDTGCADCHKPLMNTNRRRLPFKFTGGEQQPFADTFYEVDLSRSPTRFRRNRQGGIQVRLFSDLKRYNMGPAMSEEFEFATEQQNQEYVTARLWGIADTAPYMHDGRALTIPEAIDMHGGDAAYAADNYRALTAAEQAQLLAFLMSLRTPTSPARDLLNNR